MRPDRGLHHTGTRYPGHGRKRPKAAYAGPPRTGPPPDDDPPAAEPNDDAPFEADLALPGDERLGGQSSRTSPTTKGAPTGRPFRVLLPTQLARGR